MVKFKICTFVPQPEKKLLISIWIFIYKDIKHFVCP